MDSSCSKISQAKLDIKNVFDSLQQLNHAEGQIDVENLIVNTEFLLGKLEKNPLKKYLKSKIRKRQKQKLRKKLLMVKNAGKSTNKIHEIKLPIELKSLIPKEIQKSNHHGKSIQECKRFLQTFELLEQLHYTRGHNSSETYKFAMQLHHLKSIWNSLLQDKLKEQTSNEIAIQKQWNEVLFGPPEKIYFEAAPDLQDFVRKRQVWDSYINSKHGSSIPIGWIMPVPDVKKEWKPYLAPKNLELIDEI